MIKDKNVYKYKRILSIFTGGNNMLNNIQKSRNFVIPFAPHNDSIQVQSGGILVWDGWVLIWPSVSEKDSLLKTTYFNFKLVPLAAIK